MPPDHVEREILIEASPEVVWGVITEPKQIRRWFSDDAELDEGARPGAEGSLTWKPGGRGAEKDSDLVVPIQVVEAEPFRRFVFRWNHPQGAQPDESNSALVEFTLTEEASGTRLRVLESGIGAVTRGGEEEDRYRESHERGWGKHFGELREYLAAKTDRAAR